MSLFVGHGFFRKRDNKPHKESGVSYLLDGAEGI
jgi:hypothetical protein